jgi:hypothetical protein
MKHLFCSAPPPVLLLIRLRSFHSAIASEALCDLCWEYARHELGCNGASRMVMSAALGQRRHGQKRYMCCTTHIRNQNPRAFPPPAIASYRVRARRMYTRAKQRTLFLRHNSDGEGLRLLTAPHADAFLSLCSRLCERSWVCAGTTRRERRHNLARPHAS